MAKSRFPIEWVEANMPRSRRSLENLPDLSHIRLAMSMHLDIKMVPLVRGLTNKGAQLYITTCNPTTTRDDVVKLMRETGAEVGAAEGMSDADWQSAIAKGLDWGPTHLSEMGSDYTHHLISHDMDFPTIKAGLEATGSGINRLQGKLPSWPIFNWDDVPVKEGLHNRHMVGLTTWHAFYNATLVSLHEKNVLIVGYGTVGQGLAASAKAYGGTVKVAEVDPARLLQARYDGWQTGTVEEFAPLADMIVTGTGAHHVLPRSIIEKLKDGCFILNSGHKVDEIELEAFAGCPKHEPIPYITTYSLTSSVKVHVFAGGAMANLTAGEGDSLNAFDLTLAIMTEGIAHIVGKGENAAHGVHLLPRMAWERACPDA